MDSNALYEILLPLIAFSLIISEVFAISKLVGLLKHKIKSINIENNLIDFGDPYKYANAILFFYIVIFFGSFLYLLIKMIKNTKEGIAIGIIFDVVLIIFGAMIYLSYAILKKIYQNKK